MRLKTFLTLSYLLLITVCYTQTIIHSHNDYAHDPPFWDAYNNKAGVIEADIYPVNGELMVAHDKKNIKAGNTLKNMYILPIVQLFGNKQKDSAHSFYLMIDIKEDQKTALEILMNILRQYPSVFDRAINKNAVQVFISGERPPDSSFHTYPRYIMFDGLPGKHYTINDLDKIVMISDNFRSYSTWNGSGIFPAADSINISNMIQAAHATGKPVRLWGAPDTQQSWGMLLNLHADVINTDKVEACRQFLDSIKHE